MKQILDIYGLKQGDKIVHFNGERIDQWEFLMIHPHNDQYVLLLDTLSQNAFKQYIPNILNTDEWQRDYKIDDVLEQRIAYHNKQIERIKERLDKTKKMIEQV